MKSLYFPEVSYADWRRLVETQVGEDEVESILTGHADGVDFEALCSATHPQARAGNTIIRGATSWIPCQVLGQSDTESLKYHLKDSLRGGAEGIRLILDRAVRLGEDPSSSEKLGEGGAALYRQQDVAHAFQGAPSSWKALILEPGGSFMAAASMILGWLQESGIHTTGKTVLLGADPLGSLARDGELPASINELSDDLTELTGQCLDSQFASRAITVSGLPYREAGAEIDQELAICLSSAVEYLRRLDVRGIDPEVAASQLAFLTGTGQQMFLEVAKIRALRVLWGQVLRACGVKQPIPAWIHACALNRSLPSREPANNLLRVTAASWAAVLGGADSVESPSYDWFEGNDGSDRGRRLARNTQLILGLEGQIGRVMDPAAGSYLVENITRDLVNHAWRLFREIEGQGGLLRTLESGSLSEAVRGRWERRYEDLKSGTTQLIGINAYPDPDSTYAEKGTIDPDQLSIIRQAYARQSEESRSRRVTDLESAPNRWRWCLEAAQAGLSVYEMNSRLYPNAKRQTVSPFLPQRDCDPFERETAGT